MNTHSSYTLADIRLPANLLNDPQRATACIAAHLQLTGSDIGTQFNEDQHRDMLQQTARAVYEAIQQKIEEHQ